MRFLLFAIVTSTLATCGWGLSLSEPPLPTLRSPKHNPQQNPDSFIVAQYNVLAGTLGSNTHPWFLHGLADLSDDRRASIAKQFYRRHPHTGKLLKIGWPHHVEGILSLEEQRIVEDIDRRYFAWDVRKERLVRTIRELNADLLSLVECDYYESFWKQEMARLGYGGVYKRRPRRGCSDGCAIFYRKTTFDLVACQGVNLTDRKTGKSQGTNDDDDDDRPISRIGETADRVALLALFRHIPTSRHLIFVSTHLARNPEDRGKTKERARQIAQILYHVTLFAEEHEQKVGEAPVVLAGDLNETNLWHLGTLARIKCGVADKRCHPFIITSRAAASPMPTSITSCRSMRIDYILLQPSLLEVCESVFEMGQDGDGREGEECRILADPADHIPNERHPSDHVPVAFRLIFKDYQSAAEGCAASWLDTVEKWVEPARRTNGSPSPGAVLRLEELKIAFSYFDENGDGVCNLEELSSGIDRLRVGSADTIRTVLLEGFSRDERLTLTLDGFRSIYVRIWLRQQSNFLDRVRSVRTMFDLNVDSSNFSSGLDDCLFTEMDGDGDGVVNVGDVIDHLARVEKSEDSLRTRIADAFSFFEFISGKDFAMSELHQCFVDACPFEVSTDILQVAFDDMGKAHDERVELDEFIDWLIRMYFRKDIGWISLVGPVPK